MAVVLSGSASGGEARRVEMTVGEQQIFTVPGLVKVSASGTGVADVKPLGGDQFILYAQGEGRASLGVFRNGHEVQMWEVIVRGLKAEKLKASCADLLGRESCADLKIVPAGDNVVLSGSASSRGRFPIWSCWWRWNPGCWMLWWRSSTRN
jgi:Flp pilus assembly secretin CpaC